MHNLMLAALKSLSNQYPAIKILSLGQILEEDYYQFIQGKIQEYGLEGHIRLMGFVDNIRAYYQLADAFLLPSLIEGWGLVTLEAMYHGLPLILTRTGGAEELVENGDIGILINNCFNEVTELNDESLCYYAHLDYPSNTGDLVKAMLDLYRKREYWKEVGKKGRDKVLSRYTLDRILPIYEREFIKFAIEGKNLREIRRIQFLKKQARLIEEERIKIGNQFRRIQGVENEILNQVQKVESKIENDKRDLLEKINSIEGVFQNEKKQVLKKLGSVGFQLDYVLRRLSIKERLKERLDKIESRFKKGLPTPIKNHLRPLYHQLFSGNKGQIRDSLERSEDDNKKIYENLIIKFHNFFFPKEVNKRHASLMGHLLARKYERIFIYPPTINWGFHLFQRPHQIFRVLAEKGYLCFFCVPDPEPDGVDGLKEAQENLFLCGNMSLLRTFLGDKETIIWTTWTPHKIFCEYFPKSRVIYDFIDELNVFYGYSELMEEDHHALLQGADLVVTTATSLWEKVKRVRKDTLLVPNGVYLDDFKMHTPPSIPKDLVNVMKQGKPIIGYYGALAEWLNYEIINYIVQSCKGYNIVLIGPNYDGSMKQLQNAENLFWLGSKEYKELKNYLYFFDVAMIPFKISEVTNSTSPLKLFEYMAGGKPIVTTDVKECRKYKSVFTAKDEEDFVRKIGLAWEKRNDPEYLNLLKKEAEENSWHARVEHVLDEFKKRGFKK